jgi:hypothetical protein
MRATELIGHPVHDLEGVRLGVVHDLRFEMTWIPEHQLVCRLTGLACSDTAGVGHRLGYGTGDMTGPWPLSALFTRRRQRRWLEIDWQDVATHDPTGITLRRSRRDLQRNGTTP